MYVNINTANDDLQKYKDQTKAYSNGHTKKQKSIPKICNRGYKNANGYSGDWIVNLTKMGCIFSTSQLHEKKEVQYNTADPYTIFCIGV